VQSCITPYPESGVLYQDDAFKSSRSAIAIDAANSTTACYYKIYSGETLAATMFINAGSKVEVDLPPGTYTLKQARGKDWFGEQIMFGDTDIINQQSYYETLVFEDGSDRLDLGDNIIMNISLAAATTGNISGRATDPGNF
jgi:hypothetical protein